MTCGGKRYKSGLKYSFIAGVENETLHCMGSEKSINITRMINKISFLLCPFYLTFVKKYNMLVFGDISHYTIGYIPGF